MTLLRANWISKKSGNWGNIDIGKIMPEIDLKLIDDWFDFVDRDEGVKIGNFSPR